MTATIRNITLQLTVCFILFFSGYNSAQTISVPIDIQVKLLPKILSLEKNINSEITNQEIKIGVIYDSKIRNSLKVKEDIFRESEKEKLILKNTRIKFVEINLSQINSLKDSLQVLQLDAVLIAPLRGYDISGIAGVCKQLKIISFTSVPGFIDQGISGSFDLVDNKLKIWINLASAKAEGANFSSHLLKIANVIDKNEI